MARRRKHFSGTKAAHRSDAARNASTLRFEKKIIRQHLAQGECRQAINGLVHMGMAAGKLIANRTWAGKPQKFRMTSDLRRLAERVSTKCVLYSR